MPRYFRDKNKTRLLIFSTILLLLLAASYAWAMKVFLNHMLVPVHFNFSWNYSDLEYNRFFIALLGILGGGFVKLALDQVAAQRKLDTLEKANALAELTYLKAQLNPHFLFNSLNGLYTQLDFDRPKAKDSLVAIADLLRYQLYECNADLVPLQKEMAYLDNYFNLQRQRLDNCSAELSISGNQQPYQITPLLLMPFVENAFKYVSDDDDRTNTIRIAVEVRENQLHFACVNTTSKIASHVEAHAKGIGLQNVRQRLGLLYPDRHTLVIRLEEGKYIVNLTLTLHAC